MAGRMKKGGPERIAKALLPLALPISRLKPHAKNARLHPDRNLQVLASLLTEFGQRKPVVVWKGGVVIAGNGLLAAARSLGWERLAAADASDLSEDQADAYALADNKSSDLSEFDFQVVADVLRGLPDTMRLLTGFSDFEIEPLLQAMWEPPAASDHAPEHSVSFRATEAQARAIREGIERVRAKEPDATDGRALEVMADAFR